MSAVQLQKTCSYHSESSARRCVLPLGQGNKKQLHTQSSHPMEKGVCARTLAHTGWHHRVFSWGTLQQQQQISQKKQQCANEMGRGLVPNLRGEAFLNKTVAQTLILCVRAQHHPPTSTQPCERNTTKQGTGIKVILRQRPFSMHPPLPNPGNGTWSGRKLQCNLTSKDNRCPSSVKLWEDRDQWTRGP